jgi:hypothetical protein
VRERGWKAEPPRRFVGTSDGAAVASFPGLARGVRPGGPDQLWFADLTDIRFVERLAVSIIPSAVRNTMPRPAVDRMNIVDWSAR